MATQATWVEDVIKGLSALVTPAEVEACARIKRRKINQLVADGRLCAVRHAEGGLARLLIPRESIASYLRSLDVGV